MGDSLWTSLNEMGAANRETELEDGSGGEADQRCSDSEGPGVLRRLETDPFPADVISRPCILQAKALWILATRVSLHSIPCSNAALVSNSIRMECDMSCFAPR